MTNELGHVMCLGNEFKCFVKANFHKYLLIYISYTFIYVYIYIFHIYIPLWNFLDA